MEGDKYRKKLRFVLKFFSKQKFVFYETRFLLQEEREKRCALSNSAREESCEFSFWRDSSKEAKLFDDCRSSPLPPQLHIQVCTHMHAHITHCQSGLQLVSLRYFSLILCFFSSFALFFISERLWNNYS